MSSFIAEKLDMREILEWHAALKTGIERGYLLSDVWFGNFRRQIQSSLKQAEAAASTKLNLLCAFHLRVKTRIIDITPP
jgi:hypothetical protein